MLHIIEALLPEAPEWGNASAWTNKDAWHMWILRHMETLSSKQSHKNETIYYIS